MGLVVDVCSKVLDRVVGLNILEAMIGVAFNKKPQDISNDNYLELIEDYHIEPRFCTLLRSTDKSTDLPL